MNRDTIASRVGRPPKFKTPLELAEIADKYFAWCEANPIETSRRRLVGAKQTGKGSEAKSDETVFTAKRPYTLDGFCLFANISDWNAMKKKRTYKTQEFVGVIYAIEATIRDQQVSGAAVGIFNSNLVARLNGIADKKDITSDGERISGNTTVIGWPEVLKESDKVRENELYE
jgi:hypothetical protein